MSILYLIIIFIFVFLICLPAPLYKSGINVINDEPNHCNVCVLYKYNQINRSKVEQHTIYI
jgi:hypothetical protein